MNGRDRTANGIHLAHSHVWTATDAELEEAVRLALGIPASRPVTDADLDEIIRRRP